MYVLFIHNINRGILNLPLDSTDGNSTNRYEGNNNKINRESRNPI